MGVVGPALFIDANAALIRDIASAAVTGRGFAMGAEWGAAGWFGDGGPCGVDDAGAAGMAGFWPLVV